TIDGGKTWEKTLGDDEWTGVTDIDIDPNNPNVIYAATWQRHRTVAAYMGGGIKSAIYRSDDGGETWKKIMKGISSGKKGKIGIAVSPIKTDVVYAAVELNRRKGAVYKSTNRGETWVKQSNTVSGGTGPHYYQELWASPHKFDKIYLANVRMLVSEDGGKSFKQMSEKYKHSDNHVLKFYLDDPQYLLVGTDGGLYESFDDSKSWRFIDNLPVTQFYKIAVDDKMPFYQIYGGTQDNSTQVGPSQTDERVGIANRNWEIVLFADGHQPATTPDNPDIVYAEWQEGNLVRVDRTTGEIVYIQPQPGEGEPIERYNWDSPILVSPHSPKRLYYGSYRVWKSDDRGDDWVPISGDLTNYTERFDMPIMGKKQSWDSPWDVYAMSSFNTITSISESPVKEGMLYIGTDDGLIQVTENDGETWNKINVEKLPGVPEKAFVNDIKADLFDENTAYVCLDNHKTGDFSPHLLKTVNKGKTWKSIKGDLPDTTIVWRLVQDDVDPQLLFIGTEFGIYFTNNGGKNWIKMNTGANVSFRDLAIQRREHDLVAGSFGRGIFILDDYTPLRKLKKQFLEKKAGLIAPEKADWYIRKNALGRDSKGAGYFMAKNPPFGAVFTYYLKNDVKSLKQIRQENEKNKNDQDIDFPGWEKLDKEIIQEKPEIFITILDQNNKLVSKVKGVTKIGVHRLAWNLRFASNEPIKINSSKNQGIQNRRNNGFMVAPGKYKAFLAKKIDGKISIISDTVSFDVVPLRHGALKGADYKDVSMFWKELSVFRGDLSILRIKFNKIKKIADAMEIAV
ncbi:MAG TPA: glycosyl hydrolase, partial [Bacteroidetes bacterium]|nr:glycosyl hydrolase [Bacteroidota bacterium]